MESVPLGQRIRGNQGNQGGGVLVLMGTVTDYLSVTSKPRFLHLVCGDAPPPEPVAGARVRSPSRPAISPLWPVSRLRHSADRQVSSGWWLVIWETGRGSWGLWWHATKAVSSLPLATARHKILGDLTETETLYFPLVSNPKSGMSLCTQFTAASAPTGRRIRAIHAPNPLLCVLCVLSRQSKCGYQRIDQRV